MTTKQPTIQIPKFTEVAKAARSDIEAVEGSAMLIDNVMVTTNDAMEIAAQLLAEIKTTAKDIDSRRKGFTQPLQAVVKDINAFFKPAIDSLGQMEKTLKTRIEVFITDSLSKRDKLLGGVESATTAPARAALISEASEIEPRELPGVSIRESWQGEVTNAEELVEWAVTHGRLDLLQPNEAVLQAAQKTKKYDPQIPGWAARCRRSVVITPSKM